MAEEDDSQKTEEPTDRKLSKARDKGQVGSSMEVKNWAILMGGGAGVALLSPWMMERLANHVVMFIENAATISITQSSLPIILADSMIETGIILAPFFAILMVLAVVANVVQSGWIMAPSKLKPELKKYH